MGDWGRGQAGDRQRSSWRWVPAGSFLGQLQDECPRNTDFMTTEKKKQHRRRKTKFRGLCCRNEICFSFIPLCFNVTGLRWLSMVWF